MMEEMGVELIRVLISNLSVPGNTGYELLALSVLFGILVWSRRRK